MSKIWYVIPARRNSKGLRYKNRKLLQYTLDTVPNEYKNNVVITTDDEEIIDRCTKQNIQFINRVGDLASDTADIRSVMQDFIDKKNIPKQDIIVMLYLTYPQRKWKQIHNALEHLIQSGSRSLLCAKEVKSHPYLCIYEENGRQIVEHDLYRRQDYPKCLEISHYICAFFASEIKKLNKNMYNGDTTFYKIEEVIDVDREKDLKLFIEKKYDKNNSRDRNQS